MTWDIEWRILDDAGNETLVEGLETAEYTLTGAGIDPTTTRYELRAREVDGGGPGDWTAWVASELYVVVVNATGTGAFAPVTLTPPAGEAAGTVVINATATGAFAPVSLDAPSGAATGTVVIDATAAGSFAPVSLSAPSGSATGAAVVNAEASGAFAPISLVPPSGAASGVEVTLARPTADISAGQWLPSEGDDLYAMINEVEPDDTDYIYATTPTITRLSLGAVSLPADSARALSFRAWSPGEGGLIVRLYQGETMIASRTYASLSPTVAQQKITLTTEEAETLTDGTALELELEATA